MLNNNIFGVFYHICQGSQYRFGDFRWYRLVGFKNWSYKPDQARPTFKDNDNKDIKDHRKAKMDSYKIVAFMESCKEDTVNIKNNDVCHLVLLGTNRNNYLISDTDIHPVEK